MSDLDCMEDEEMIKTNVDFMDVLEIAKEHYNIDTSKIIIIDDLTIKNKDKFLERWSEVYRKLLRKVHPDKNRNIDDLELKQINEDLSHLLSSVNERLKCFINYLANGKTLGGKKTRRQKSRRQKSRRQQRRKSSKRS